MLALPSAFAHIERGQDGYTGKHPGGIIRDRRTDTLRLAISLSGHRHYTRLRLRHKVIAWARGIGAILSIAADRAVNQARIDLSQCFIVQPLFFQRPRAEVFDQHRSRAHKFKQPLLMF